MTVLFQEEGNSLWYGGGGFGSCRVALLGQLQAVLVSPALPAVPQQMAGCAYGEALTEVGLFQGISSGSS